MKKAELSTGISMNMDGDMQTLSEDVVRSDTGEMKEEFSHDARPAHVMRVGDWQCEPIYHIDLGRPHRYSLDVESVP